jgi:hypothetical protein
MYRKFTPGAYCLHIGAAKWKSSTCPVKEMTMNGTLNGLEGEVQMQRRFGKNIVRAFGVTGMVSLLPLVALQFTGEVVWTGFDFAVAGALLLGTGLAYAFATRKIRDKRQRLLIGAGLLAVLMGVWVELAVGFFH